MEPSKKKRQSETDEVSLEDEEHPFLFCFSDLLTLSHSSIEVSASEPQTEGFRFQPTLLRQAGPAVAVKACAGKYIQTARRRQGASGCSSSDFISWRANEGTRVHRSQHSWLL